MKCPIDNESLVMTERSGVEIDYCPKCRGVWLDRGELDKIIERGAQASSSPQPEKRERRDYDDDDRHRGHYGQKPHYKKRESFLSDLFDF
jgi:Zn-finger nucleic acid-binding protein